MTETATLPPAFPAESPLRAPLHAATVTLAVRDLAETAGFYQHLLGLVPLPATAPGRMTLAAGPRPLLHLVHAPTARPDSGREPGLFHTAFLLPGRAALAAWLHHAAEGVAIDGASDHGVSEAIYLSDPEGNGIEVYADRPRAAWPAAPGGGVGMFTRRLDLAALMATAPGPAMPGADTVIGHVHLRTNDVAAAESFYTALGFAVMQHLPQASFLSTGGYHHHLAANTWASGGSLRRPAGLTGLLEVELHAADAATFARVRDALRGAGAVLQDGDTFVVAEDPAGNGLRVVLPD